MERNDKAILGAFKKEKNSDLCRRMHAVYLVVVKNRTIADVADITEQSVQWIYKLTQRYEKEGLDGLRDRPKSGTPPKVERRILEQIQNIPDSISLFNFP
ncbi:MAG: Winged helix-turn-helix containing protein [Cenarchaeum symbiont of Oopsacas minuta]|nr:Winged helix-turn-helix containing protein [Cenarchaeum symbiont of Oopsacas minuta]